MSDVDRLLAAARAWRGDALALATVISTWGSAPRPRGSHMLVNQDGRFEGSVSGGCVEGEILHVAQQVIADGIARVEDYGVADAAAWEVGLPCGGNISVLVQPVGAAGFPPELFDRIDAARANGEVITLTTELATGRTQPGEDGDFVNRYRPPRRLIVVGAVQIAQSLIPMARELDIAPVLIDPRERFLTEARFPGVELDSRWPDEAVAARRPDANTAVVTLSHDIKIDDPALIAALRMDTGYIGALGSRKSHQARLERLRLAGFDEPSLRRIEGPAGIDIRSIGAAEIALSILAGAIRTLNESG